MMFGPGGDQGRSRRVGFSFWLQAASAGLAGTVGLMTMLWHDWIEIVFAVDPDHYSGALEWVVVSVCLLVAVVLAALARNNWRRLASAAWSSG